MSKPLVSIITPAYNSDAYIAECIESVFAQTYQNWELIIIDDGSTDDTKTIVQKYVLQDNRVKFFYQPNSKQGKARNLAIKKSTGCYLAFLDSDDIMLPERLTSQLELITQTNSDVIFSNACLFKKLPLKGSEETFNVVNKVYQGEFGLNEFLHSNKIPMSTAFAKKSVIIEVGMFSEKLSIQNAEDYHLWLKVLINGNKILSTNHINAAYRLHSQSVTFYDKKSLLQVLYVLEDLMANKSNDMFGAFKRRKLEYYRMIEKSDKYDYFFKAEHLFYFSRYGSWAMLIFRIIDSILGTPYSMKLLYHFCVK